MLFATYAIADTDGFPGSSAPSGAEPNGTYININGGFATQQFMPTGYFAATANAGYNFNPGFALEGGYALLQGSQFGSTVSNSIFDMAAKGTIHLSDIFSLYGRLGAGVDFVGWSGTANNGTPSWFCQNNTGTDWVWLAGVGGSFRLSEHFDLHLEDTLYIPQAMTGLTVGQTNLTLFGGQYNF